MKKLTYIITIAVAALSLASCNKVLEEQPRTFFEPGFFQTEAGVKGGITALYASLRYVYGQAYYYNINTTGTDEATYGQSADSNFKDADLSGVGSLNPSSSRSDALWGMAFTYINTASGIIENATAVKSIPASLVAEAKFFRAFYYFQLVQTFGGVPLDLGSGEMKFNSTPVRTSTRNTVPEVYTAIFKDLEEAVKELPDAPRVVGGVTKNVARLVLAKAYLTYGWWNENPGNIDTYPKADRKPADAKGYYQKALDLCNTAINKHGVYHLCDPPREVTLHAHDRNKKTI
ncbi:MAG: RagB/SusD family nutrient uptake outer membrane protein, partial [Bacteroidales bacterium]|nr:RagB/SusD family nutrient uptake outer membrane protein [Bacteroidales bacterium]